MSPSTTKKNARIRLLEDFEYNHNCSCLYKVSSRQKVRNILVDCNYFENKGVRSPKNITCSVTIKVLGVRRNNKPIYWFELYGNTLNTKYNHMTRITTDYEIPLREGDMGYDTFKRVMEVVNGEFDQYTKTFIDCTMKMIEGDQKLNKTPQFILDVIEDARNIDEEKVINAN